MMCSKAITKGHEPWACCSSAAESEWKGALRIRVAPDHPPPFQIRKQAACKLHWQPKGEVKNAGTGCMQLLWP